MSERREADAPSGLNGATETISGSRRLGCVVFGHDHSFGADGFTMYWRCRRDCGAGGCKTYASTDDAARYAAAFDRRDSSDIGSRAPLIGLLPLRLWRRLQTRNGRGPA